MATFKERFPSRNEIFLASVVCALPIYVWSVIKTLNELPGWVMRLNTWDLIGVVAYTQAFALIESLVVLLLLLFGCAILPAQLFRNKFVAISALIVILTSAWFILAHYNDEIMRLWGLKQFAIWGGIYCLSIVLGALIVHRFERLEKAINDIVQRLIVLSSVYILMGILSVTVVIIRNIS